MFFWTAAALLAGLVAALIMLQAARKARRGTGAIPDPAFSLYQRQLHELDDLAARGVLNEADRKSAFAEAARRLLSVAPAPPEHPSDNTKPIVVVAVIFVCAVAALALYAAQGRPGVGDQPYAGRLAKWKGAPVEQLDPPQIAAVLSALARERPKDVQLLVFLGQAQLAADKPAEAVIALRRAAALAPDHGPIQSLLGRALVASSADESVSAEAEDAFRRAVAADPSDAAAQYFLALAEVSRGGVGDGVARWRRLQASLPAGDPRRSIIEERIAEVDSPAQQDPAETEMIAGMVSRLAERLRTSPNDPDGWVRLVHAYGVLGKTNERSQAVASARKALAGRPDALARFEAGLRSAR